MDDEREKRGEEALGLNELTLKNVRKVTRFREGGEDALEGLVRRFESMGVGKEDRVVNEGR